MMKLTKLVRFLRDRRALESSEYGVLAAAIIVLAYGAYQLLGGNIAAVVTNVANAM